MYHFILGQPGGLKLIEVLLSFSIGCQTSWLTEGEMIDLLQFLKFIWFHILVVWNNIKLFIYFSDNLPVTQIEVQISFIVSYDHLKKAESGSERLKLSVWWWDSNGPKILNIVVTVFIIIVV